jgi:hypothetical protein
MEGCVVTDLSIDSKTNCYRLNPEQMQQIQSEISVSTTLEPGINLIKIKSGSFGYQSEAGFKGEPLVLLWIYGGKVINKKTNVEVEATWSSLNGYDDTLTLEVKTTATLCAFFFDTHLDDNTGTVEISVVRI